MGKKKLSSKMMINYETCESRIIGHLLLLSADFKVVNTNFPYSLMSSIKRVLKYASPMCSLISTKAR